MDQVPWTKPKAAFVHCTSMIFLCDSWRRLMRYRVHMTTTFSVLDGDHGEKPEPKELFWGCCRQSIVVAYAAVAVAAAAVLVVSGCVIAQFISQQHRSYEDSSRCRRIGQNITRASRDIRLRYATNFKNNAEQLRATKSHAQATSSLSLGKRCSRKCDVHKGLDMLDSTTYVTVHTWHFVLGHISGNTQTSRGLTPYEHSVICHIHHSLV